MNRKITALIALVILAVSFGRTGSASARTVAASVDSYRDIPGVTEAEIAAVERLKAEKGSFSFGHLREIDAIQRPDGSYAGFTSEFCEFFSGLFGIEFTRAAYDDWHALKKDVDSRAVDFTGELTPSLGRTRDYYMTNPIAYRMQKIYTLTDSAEITSEKDISGLRLGFLENSVNIEPILKRYPDLQFETVFADYISSVEDMLVSGEIDAFVSEKNLDMFFMQSGRIRSKDFFPLAYTSVSLATSNPELKPVISVMDKYLAAGGDARLYELYKESEYEYTRQRLMKSFTEEEAAYLEALLADGSAINVALEHDNYPNSFYNTEEKIFQGVAVDVLAEVSKLTGLTFRNVTTENTLWTEILDLLRSGEASLVSQLGYSEVRARSFIWSRVSYASNYYALISKMDYPAVESYQIPRLRVGTFAGSVYEDVYLEWFPDSDNLIGYDTQNDAFDALEKGEIDVVMGAEYMLLAQENYREKSGYIINYRFEDTIDQTFGYNRDMELLRSIMDKAQTHVGLETISNYWNGRVFNYTQKISQIRTAYLLVFSSLAFVALLVVGSLLWKNKRLGKSLIERTVTISTIYSSIPDTIFSKDVNGFYTSCNPSFEKQAGLPESALIGKTFEQVFEGRASETSGLSREIDEKVISEGSSELLEETIIYPDGCRRVFETLKAPLIQSGRTVGLLGIGRDVTDRNEVEHRLEKIINTAQLAFILTIDDTVVEANDYCRTQFGMKPGDDIRAFYSDPGARDEIIATAGLFGMASNVIVRYNMADGEVHRFLVNMTFVGYEQRSAYIVWALDIEQDEMKNDQLRITQQSFHKVLDVLPMPIRIVELESRNIVYANESLVKMLEYESVEDVCGLNLYDIVPAVMSDGATADERINQILSAAEPAAIEIEYLTKSGRVIEFTVFTRQIDYKGKLSSIGILKDLTIEKENARILREAAAKEKEANQAKSTFLANMSHEIRTPMNGIIGMTDLLIGERLSGRQLQYAKDVKTSAESLLGIINDILDLSKIGEGKLQIMPVDIDLSILLKNTASMIRFSARSKGLDFIDDIRINSPEYVRVDDVRLKQVIINLLANAVKFTETGYVKLTAEIKDGEILFDVVDTGMGIKEEELSLIFAAFEQADKRKNRAIKGTGLGLSISKSLVELMGGRVWVESEYGVGTTFHVSIPYERGDEKKVEKTQAQVKYIYAPKAQVLLVDDIQTNLTVGAGLLRMCGITADVAASGRMAIELVKEKDYDLVFMDHMMPEMDGIEAMDLIREMGGKYLLLPIVALTANAVNESKELLLTSGMNDFLSKPIDHTALMSILQKWLPPDKIEADAKPSEEKLREPLSEALLAVSEIDGIDIEMALGRISGMQDVLETSIIQAAHAVAERLGNMDRFLSSGDLRGFSIEAHGFKGALSNIGAVYHSDLAAELEAASKAGNTALCMEKFAVFADIMEDLAGKLNAAFPHKEDALKPPGDNRLLPLKLEAAIACLNEFETADALANLEALNEYTFGAETDAALDKAKDLIKAFKPRQAVPLLTELMEG